MSLYQLFYVSTARPNIQQTDINSILRSAHSFNPLHDLTGLLLFRGGYFVQVLEGEKKEVQNIYNKITTDPRHHNHLVIFERYEEQRMFGQWSMGFCKIEDIDLSLIEQFFQWRDLVDGKVLDTQLITNMLSEFKVQRIN